MANCSATSSFAKLQPKLSISKGDPFMLTNATLRIQRRQCLCFSKGSQTCWFSSSSSYAVQAPILFHCAKSVQCLNENFSRSYCWGTLVDPDNTAPVNWVSAVDQILLMVSAIFAYIGGAVPRGKNLDFVAIKEESGSSFIPHGRSEVIESNPSLKTSAIWCEVNRKLLDAMDATSKSANLDSRAADIKHNSQAIGLSVIALNQGPTWRLLWVTLWRLQKEVCNIQPSHKNVNGDTWLIVVSQVFKGMITLICTEWLEEELSMGTGGCNMNLAFQLSEKLKSKVVILNNIKRSGKTELYADLLYFLKFDSLRSGYCFDSDFLVKHGVDILEDLVIALADAVACIYLELISVDSDLSMEIFSLGLNICSLSTRVLQRLRNEVILKQWIQQNFESVVSMYEDRFDLFVLFRKRFEDQVESQLKRSIWQMLIFRKQAIPSTSNCIQIMPISLTAKRTKELQALTGWRYYFSLFLEFSDVAMPLVRVVFNKARNALSFFLMSMIGRSLGLIFSGIRQSLGWK